MCVVAAAAVVARSVIVRGRVAGHRRRRSADGDEAAAAGARHGTDAHARRQRPRGASRWSERLLGRHPDRRTGLRPDDVLALLVDLLDGVALDDRCGLGTGVGVEYRLWSERVQSGVSERNDRFDSVLFRHFVQLTYTSVQKSS